MKDKKRKRVNIMKKTILSLVLANTLLVPTFEGFALANETTQPSNIEISNAQNELQESIGKGITVSSEGISINENKAAREISDQELIELNKIAVSQGLKEYTKKEVVDLYEKNISDLNEQIISGELEVQDNGAIIESHDNDFYVQGGSTYTTRHWWGVWHRKSTSAANGWISQLNTAANLNTGGAVAAGAVFGGVGAVPNGLTAAYLYQLANRASYWNSRNSRGIWAKINWVPVFSMGNQ